MGPHLFGYTLGHRDGDLSFDRRDSASYTPRCAVIDPAFSWGVERAPATPWDRTVIYEAHVRGLTMQHPDVPQAERGTFSALRHDAVVDHLSHLGVTAIELLPVHAYVDDQQLLERGLRNYWGTTPSASSRRSLATCRWASWPSSSRWSRGYNAGIE